MIEGLYEFLIFEKGYTYDESHETCIRIELGIDIPEEIMKDVKEWRKKSGMVASR